MLGDGFTLMEREPEESFLHVCICVPDEFMKRVRVRKVDAIGVLLDGMAPQTEIFWKGQLLDKKKSFKFYGLRHGDLVVYYREGCGRSRTWVMHMSERQDLDESIGALFNTNLRRESMRLRDLALLLQEMRPRALRRSVANFKAREVPTVAAVAHETVIGSATDGPCTEALPCFVELSPVSC